MVLLAGPGHELRGILAAARSRWGSMQARSALRLCRVARHDPVLRSKAEDRNDIQARRRAAHAEVRDEFNMIQTRVVSWVDPGGFAG